MAFILGAVVTSVFYIDFCNLVYQCGCASLWAGADAHCNVHNATGRHCPWCSVGIAGSVGLWLSVIVGQAFVAFRTSRILLTLLVFPLIGGIEALALGLWFGYWFRG